MRDRTPSNDELVVRLDLDGLAPAAWSFRTRQVYDALGRTSKDLPGSEPAPTRPESSGNIKKCR
jgi:hypothetical protein